MNLLVTGCAGFIGSHFLEEVQPCVDKLIGLDCLTYAGDMSNMGGVMDCDNFAFVCGDIRDKELVRTIFKRYEITHVAHLAAESHVDRSILAPDVFIQTNIAGTFNLLEAARMCWEGKKDRRFMHVSTDEVFGSISHGSFTEDSPYTPNSPYASSKAASDMLVRAYRHTYGLPTVITHSSNNYGPRQFPEKLIPMTISKLIKGDQIPLHGTGENVRDWIHVEDNVSALHSVLFRGEDGEIYLIGAQNERSNREVMYLLCDIFDDLKNQLRCSQFSIRNVADRPGNDLRYSVDPSKITKTLGWLPRKTFEEGLKETVQWFIDQKS